MMLVEMREVFEIIDTSISEDENNISKDIDRLIIYRLYLKYGEDLNVSIRGTFKLFCDMIFSSEYLKDSAPSSGIHSYLKQTLCDFGIYFTDKTFEDINPEKAGTRKLLILDKWDSISDYIYRCKNTKSEITDLFIRSMHDNSECDNIINLFNSSRFIAPTIWYKYNDYDMYSNAKSRNAAYYNMFQDNEIKDITSDLCDLINYNNIKSSVLIDLINYGRELYNSGIKCVVFNNFSADSRYEMPCVSFLVYLSEEYGMSINTDADVTFTKLYYEYRSGSYCLAEELFSLINDIYPVMYFVNGQTRRFVYIRDLAYSYTFMYVTLNELDLFIVGDESIKMKEWHRGIDKSYSKQVHVINKDVRWSNYIDEYNNGGIATDIDIIPIFQQFNTEEKLKEIVNSFNRYNIDVMGGTARKCITVRDLLCMRVSIDGSEEIQVGFVHSTNKDDFNYRIMFKAMVSEISDLYYNLIHPSYFIFNKDKIDKMFKTRYVFNIDKIPNRIRDLIEEACNGEDVEEVYEPDDSYCSVPEKFLYYKLTETLKITDRDEKIIIIPKGKEELSASKYSAVYTSSEIIPELLNFTSIRNISESGVVDIYGAISDKFIGTRPNGNYFNIRNELFGVMK